MCGLGDCHDLTFRWSTYYNQHEHGTDAALQKTEEESLDVNALIALADSCQDQTKAPGDNDSGSDTLNWVALGEDHGRIRSNNEAKVEDGGCPGVSVANKEVQVISKSKDCLS